MNVKLTKPHTHAGKEYQPGDVIELEPDQVDWLVGLGAGERVDPADTDEGETQ